MSPTDCLGTSWAELGQRLCDTRALSRWGDDEPALAELGSLDELVAIMHGDRDQDRTDRIFAALLRTAAADAGADENAGLLIAHLLENATSKLARGLRDLSPDIDALVAGALWVEIRAFRWQHRGRGYAKGLLLDTRASVVRELCPPRTADGVRMVSLLSPAMAADLADEEFLDESAPPDPAAGDPVDDERELVRVLAWAQRTGLVAAADIALLVELELADVNHRRAVAQRHGVHERTLRRRCNRTKTLLHEARFAFLEQAA